MNNNLLTALVGLSCGAIISLPFVMFVAVCIWQVYQFLNGLTDAERAVVIAMLSEKD